MSKFMILTLAAWSASVIQAQQTPADITGTWQGTLSGDRQLRLVFKISHTNDGGLRALIYNLDQGAKSFSADTVLVQSSNVKISFAGIRSGYEGKLSSDQNALTGSWKTAAGPYPLTLARATPQTAWTIPDVTARSKPMRPDASPAFEVATIKPSDPTRKSSGFTLDGRRVLVRRETLRAVIMMAYGVHPSQISGTPGWADSDYYDIAGQPDEPGQPSLQQMRVMLRKLLADRFQFVCHRESRELSVYTLVAARSGPKIARSERDPNGTPDQTIQNPGFVTETNVTMANFAEMLQASVLDRPVIDRTGLEGKFDFSLRWTPDEFQRFGQAPPDTAADAPPNLFTAVEQQLGLKLESDKASTEVVIVDRLERPSEN